MLLSYLFTIICIIFVWFRLAHSLRYLITTPVAVTESAEFLTCDLTNTRVAPTLGAGKVIVVVSSQKLVKDLQAARDRLNNYVLPLESARCRVAYGVPSSAINFLAEVTNPNPWGAPGRITFLVIREEFGF